MVGFPSWVVIAAVVGVATVARDQWLERRARTVVERWAAQHRYRLLRCRRAWFSLAFINVAPPYDASGFGRRRRPYAFDVAVEDRELGGGSRGRVSVRGDWLAGFDEEVVVEWSELNTPDAAAAPAGPSWNAAQIALLRRVNDGETTFRPDDPHTVAAGERFDLLVEHLQALQRRGFADFPAPLADTGRGGRQYAAVTGVVLTSAGREVLARVTAAPKR